MSRFLDDCLLRALGPYCNGDARILDLPSGDGDLSAKIAARGGRVVSADLFPEHSVNTPGDVVRADMNGRLPFDDDSFDVLVSQEGIEHLENLPAFFAECRRVLRDRGRLLLTTPNAMDLSSRLAWLLTGLKGFRSQFVNEHSTIWGTDNGRVYHGHAFTLPFFQIRYLLRLNQFDSIRLEGVRPSGLSRTLYYGMRPALGVLTRFVTKRRTRREARDGLASPPPELQRELLRLAVSRDLLTGRTILIDAELVEGSLRLGTDTVETTETTDEPRTATPTARAGQL